MTGDSSRDAPPPPSPAGYRSEDSKRRFTIAAGVLGALFFIAQFVLPFAVMIPIMFSFMSDSMERRSFQLERGVYWDGALWFTERSWARQKRCESSLLRVDIDGDRQPHTVDEVKSSNPWLLGGTDKLWAISGGSVRTYNQAGPLEAIEFEEKLGDIARPFLLDGLPTVVEARPGGFVVKRFKDGLWNKILAFPSNLDVSQMPINYGLQVVAIGNAIYLFQSTSAGALYFKEGWPAADGSDFEQWQAVQTPRACPIWSVAAIGDAPAIFLDCIGGHESRLLGLRYSASHTWEQFFERRSIFGETHVLAGDPPDGFMVLVEGRGFNQGVQLLEVESGEVVRESPLESLDDSGPKPERMMPLVLLPQILGYALPLALALILAVLMRKHRVVEHHAGGTSALYASVWRRALAQIIDTVLVVAPLVAIWIAIFASIEEAIRDDPSAPFKLLGGALLVSGFWGVGGLLLFSFLEGRWGWSPGKAAAGIRVRGLDLQPCGFGRALVRNLLKIVDGFFSFMVGMLLVALTEHWQRLGDLAARTVVIQVRGADRG